MASPLITRDQASIARGEFKRFLGTVSAAIYDFLCSCLLVSNFNPRILLLPKSDLVIPSLVSVALQPDFACVTCYCYLIWIFACVAKNRKPQPVFIVFGPLNLNR